MNTHPDIALERTTEATLLSRVVCGIDGSAEAEEAAREAALLMPRAGGTLLLVDAVVPRLVDSITTAIPGAVSTAEDAARKAARADLERARAAVADHATVAAIVRLGPAAALIEAEIARTRAQLVAVGSHGNGRTAGILLGSVATRLIHHASCSVLVARSAPERTFPRSIAVGIDASDSSRQALELGRVIADRLGVPLRVLHVVDGGEVPDWVPSDDGAIEMIRQDVSPADGLAARVTPADLLVVGSRGLHGLRALGSVSEAVAHRSPASVLIVRS
jgi:nucleotide-binding universal stress UspA family protein